MARTAKAEEGIIFWPKQNWKKQFFAAAFVSLATPRFLTSPKGQVKPTEGEEHNVPFVLCTGKYTHKPLNEA